MKKSCSNCEQPCICRDRTGEYACAEWMSKEDEEGPRTLQDLYLENEIDELANNQD